MSASEHREHGSGRRAVAVVIVVSTTRSLSDDTSGTLIAEQLTLAGHEVLDRRLVTDEARAIGEAVDLACEQADVVVLTGGTGLAPSDVTPEALESRFTRRIDGFGELFRMLSYEEVGAAAMLSRAVAGLVDTTVVFALPGSRKACALAMDKLVVPELPHLLKLLGTGGTGHARPAAQGQGGLVLGMREATVEPAPPPPADDIVEGAVVEDDDAGTEPLAGWTAAVRALGGTVNAERREPLPQPIEDLAPLLDLLQTAGQTAVLEVPLPAEGGRKLTLRYSLWGWPDLQRPGSKVLAVGWGEPLAEILALHRHPRLAGLCIEESRGMVDGRDADLEQVCRDRVGRAPRDTSGELFAVDSETVWIQRGNRVYEWDGKREKELGRPTQALVTIALRWSNR